MTHGRYCRLQLRTMSASFTDTQQQSANRKNNKQFYWETKSANFVDCPTSALDRSLSNVYLVWLVIGL